MYSLTKTPIDTDTIFLLTKDAFGKNTKIGEITELTDGWFCSAFSVQLLEKDFDVVLKVAPPPDVPTLTYERGITLVDVEANLLVSKNTSVPVPKIMYYNFDRDLINRDYFFMEKFTGPPLNKAKAMTQADKDMVMRECGTFTAQINSIKGSRFGYYAENEEIDSPSWRDSFLNMIRLMLDDGKSLGADYFMEPEKIMQIMENKASALEEIAEPRLVHWDIWDANIFVKKIGGSYSIEGITDFERALWGDPLMEATFMNIKTELAFIDGYEQESGVPFDYTNEKKCRRIMYNIYLFLHMVTENYSRKYTGGNSAGLMQWADNSLKESVKKLKEWRL
jgi:aminoglycoside phosphotransferase (APT) family kinase protein